MQIRVRAVIIKDNKSLALERKKKGDHYWCFPGGGVEEGESEQEALTRECQEEIGIKIKVGTKIWEQKFKGDKENFYCCQIIDSEGEKDKNFEYETIYNYAGSHKPVWLKMIKLENYDLRPNDLRNKIIFLNLLKQFKKLYLPKDKYAIYGSGPMGIRSLKSIDDLDIIVKKDLYEKLKKDYSESKPGCIRIGKIEIFPTWNAIIDNPDKMIDRAEEIEGFKFVRLKDLIVWKKKMGRKKDFEDIKLIRDYLEKL